LLDKFGIIVRVNIIYKVNWLIGFELELNKEESTRLSLNTIMT